MKYAVVLFFGCFLFPSVHVTAQEKEGINWLTFEQLSDSLSLQPKKTLLFFHTDWCVYCRKMEQEVFRKPEVISAINTHYYAVHLDAETQDTIAFDGHQFVNQATQKRRGQFHDLALLLAQRNGQFSAPTLILLDEEFFVRSRHFEYLDSKKLLRLLNSD